MGENQVQQGLYSQSFEHDNCGIGAVVNIKGRKDHQIVADALKIVEQLEHRAGKDAEGKTGDGVGILTQISHRFFSRVCQEIGIELGGEREYGIGMFFFPQNELKRSQAKKMFEIIVEKEGMEFLGWREVPTAPEVLGHKARECMPVICQGFVKKPENVAVVGDQIFTDVLGGNRCKMFTILIEPIAEKDIWLTKVKRPIEIFIKKKYFKKINKGGDMD